MKAAAVPFSAKKALKKMGQDLAVARRKRRISVDDMAQRLMVSRYTLWRMEKGSPGVAIGVWVTAALIVGRLEAMAEVFGPSEDIVALSLDEERLPKRIHPPKGRFP